MPSSITEIESPELSCRVVPGKIMVEELPIELTRGKIHLPANQMEGNMICKLLLVGAPELIEGREFPFPANVGDHLVCRQYDGELLVPGQDRTRVMLFSFAEALYKRDIPWSDRTTGSSLEPFADRIVIRKDKEPKKIGKVHLPDGACDPAASGTVVAVGPGAKMLDGSGRRPIDCPVGARIAFRPYSGVKILIDREEYQIIPEIDYLGILVDGRIQPANDVVVVEKLPQIEKEGKIWLPETSERGLEAYPDRGRIIASGKGKMSKWGKFVKNAPEVDDVIIFPRLGGTNVLIDGAYQLCIASWDVLAQETA